MGLEAYLFNIQFKDPVPEKDIQDLFTKTGMNHLADKFVRRTTESYGSYYFELRTTYGLTEAHCLLPPSSQSLTDFSLRFSVLSPSSVIDQTFELLRRLNELQPIRVYDTEIANHIYRQLRKDKIVDDWFHGLEGTDKEAEINNLCYIEINAEIFRENQFSINKRSIVDSNEKGEIIESGSKTIELIERRGLFNRFIGWIRNEL